MYITEQDIKDLSIKPYPYPNLMSEFVDTRTYKRYLPELKRRETAYERDARAVNYNLSLVVDKHPPEFLRQEALLMMKEMNNLSIIPSSRSKWVGGTTSVRNNPASIFNCSFSAVNRLGVFADAGNLLMLGVGFGFRVFAKDIDQLPDLINKSFSVGFDEYEPLESAYRDEDTYSYVKKDMMYVDVGDSRQGWIDAYMKVFEVATDPKYAEVASIIYNVNSVRPIGERIKGFGGTASGPFALIDIIKGIHEVIIECPGSRLRSVDCMDCICATAKGIVAGATRRSALICLFEQGDELCRKAKDGLYTDPAMVRKSYRKQSNNTEMWHERPSLEQLFLMFESIKISSEPGFANYALMQQKRIDAAKKYRPQNPVEWYIEVGTNPLTVAA